MDGNHPNDDAGGKTVAVLEGYRALHLPGVPFQGLEREDASRALHLVGGHLRVSMPDFDRGYSISAWYYPAIDLRHQDETLFDFGTDRLLIDPLGQLVCGSNRVGLHSKQWNLITLVRSGSQRSLYLNGQIAMTDDAPFTRSTGLQTAYWGNAAEGKSPFQGKIDELAVFNRSLSLEEIAEHYQASGLSAPAQIKPITQHKKSDVASLKKYASAVLESKPTFYWALHSNRPNSQNPEFTLEGGAGPPSRETHHRNFSGGRLKTNPVQLGDDYSVELWFRNDLDNTSRLVTGYMFSRGPDRDKDCPGDHLGIGGTTTCTGRLFVFNGNERDENVEGTTVLRRGQWNHVIFIRQGEVVRIHLNGNPKPDATGSLPITYSRDSPLFVGGRSDLFANFVGGIDQVSIYDRVLTEEEIKAHYQASGFPVVPVDGEFYLR